LMLRWQTSTSLSTIVFQVVVGVKDGKGNYTDRPALWQTSAVVHYYSTCLWYLRLQFGYSG
jgi:hypothetical protein